MECQKKVNFRVMLATFSIKIGFFLYWGQTYLTINNCEGNIDIVEKEVQISQTKTLQMLPNPHMSLHSSSCPLRQSAVYRLHIKPHGRFPIHSAVMERANAKSFWREVGPGAGKQKSCTDLLQSHKIACVQLGLSQFILHHFSCCDRCK